MADARKQRWRKTSKKKRSEHARKMAMARWRKITPEELREHQRRAALARRTIRHASVGQGEERA
jgi:ABC-type thiamine transport system ATPase subunit